MSPRGCLLWLLSFGAFVLVVLWFALPPVASGLATGALGSAGFQGTDTRVEVGADPPFKLLFLDADRMRIRSTDATIQDVHADSVDILLRRVSITNRRFESIEGTLSGVTFSPPDDPPFQARSVQVTGPAEAARVTMTIAQSSVQSLVRTAVEGATGQQAGQVTLAAPDRVSVSVDGASLTGRLVVNTAGDLVILPDRGGSISLVGTGPNQPVGLQSVQVDGQELELAGTINLVQ